MRVRFYIITFYDFPRLQPVRSSVDGAKYRSFRSTSEIIFYHTGHGRRAP